MECLCSLAPLQFHALLPASGILERGDVCVLRAAEKADGACSSGLGVPVLRPEAASGVRRLKWVVPRTLPRGHAEEAGLRFGQELPAAGAFMKHSCRGRKRQNPIILIVSEWTVWPNQS